MRYRFLIRPGDGFTRRLQRSAAALASADEDHLQRLPLLVEGPYPSGSAFPESSGCKSILILAGGSGISVAISTIQRALAAVKPQVTTVKLVWAVKRRATADSVAREELRIFMLDSRFTVQWYALL